MKQITTLIVIMLLFGLSSCEYDNYDPPSIVFCGNLMTNGKSFLYDGNPRKPVLTLIQKGFGKVDVGTNVRIDETGHYQQVIFEGDYWLTLNNVQYPFEFADFKSLGTGLGYDSLYMYITSNVTRDFEVIPYYTISNFTAQVVDDDIVLEADVAVHPDKRGVAPSVVFARGYVSTSSKVNSLTTCTKSKRAVITESGHVEVAIPIHDNVIAYREIYTNNFRDYAYCRIAIELDGMDYYLFSEIKKIEGVPL